VTPTGRTITSPRCGALHVDTPLAAPALAGIQPGKPGQQGRGPALAEAEMPVKTQTVIVNKIADMGLALAVVDKIKKSAVQ
jgi:hypothetical protein